MESVKATEAKTENGNHTAAGVSAQAETNLEAAGEAKSPKCQDSTTQEGGACLVVSLTLGFAGRYSGHAFLACFD